MDERVTFEPVNRALEGNWFDKIWFFLDGHDNRYGRLLWNLDFFASFLPFHLFGEQGQIIATRSIQAIVLLTGYYMLAWSLIKANWLRMLCFICLALLPQSYYYYLMPKPEPLMVLVLGIIFYCLVNRKIRYYFLWLGVLGGLKLSAIPVCGLLAIAYFIYYPEAISIKAPLADMRRALSWHFAGVFLLMAILLITPISVYLRQEYPEQIYQYMSVKRIAGINLFYVFVAFNAVLAAFFLHIVRLFLVRKRQYAFITDRLVQLLAGLVFCNPYLVFTPFNFALYLTTPVTHGADQSDITVADWIKHIYSGVLFDQMLLLVLLAGSCMLLTGYLLYQWKKGRRMDYKSVAWLVLALFIVNLVPIVFFTKRIWSFYLLLPMVFLFLSYTLWFDSIKSIVLKLVGSLFLIAYIWWGAIALNDAVKTTRDRALNADFTAKKAEYIEVCRLVNTLAAASPEADRQVYWDPNLFFPDLITAAETKIFWGPFDKWAEGKKIVVLSDYPDRMYIQNPQNKNYEKISGSIIQFRNFTHPLTGQYAEYKGKTFRYYKIFVRH